MNKPTEINDANDAYVNDTAADTAGRIGVLPPVIETEDAGTEFLATSANTDFDSTVAENLEATEEPADDVAAARAQIEETRAHMSETIDAIKDKLSPATLVEEAKEATIGKAKEMVSDVVDTAKEKTADFIDAAKSVAHNVGDAFTGAVHSVSDAVTGTAHTVSDTVSETAQSVGDTLSEKTESARQNLTPALQDAVETAQQYAGRAAHNAKQAGETLVETIKLNPLPAAIAGFGLAWLLFSAQKQSRSSYAGEALRADDGPRDLYVEKNFGTTNLATAPQSTGNGIGATLSDTAETVRDKAGEIASTVKDKAGDAAGAVKDKASDIASSVKDGAGVVAGRASELADTVRSKAGDYAGAAKQTGQTAYNASDKFVHENTLIAGAVALLVGVAVGLALPSTAKEDEWLGQTRDRLKDQATERVGEISQKVQSVASVALGQAKEQIVPIATQAKESLAQATQDAKDSLTLVAMEAKDSLSHAAEETKEAVKTEAKDQGLAPA